MSVQEVRMPRVVKFTSSPLHHGVAMRLTISLDDDLYRYVKDRSKQDDTSMSDVINQIVRRTKEPPIEPIPVWTVRNGLNVYGDPNAPKVPMKLASEYEAEDDLEMLRRNGVIK
jgi:hypothetical protein